MIILKMMYIGWQWVFTKEGGSYWIPEYVRNYVGCVILNRVESDI